MSKLSDMLSVLGQAAPLKLGFGQARERKRNPVILLVGVADAGAKASAAAATADIVLLRPKRGGRPATSKPDGATMWGVSVADCTPEDLSALKEVGCDFILIETEATPGAVLTDEGMGRGFVLPAVVSEQRARAIEDLPLDFLQVRGAAVEWPLSMGGVLAVQERVSFYSKHMFLEVDELPPEGDLELIRDMPISALVFEVAKQDPDKVAALREAILKLEPRKPKGEHIAILPANMAAPSQGHSHEPEPDEDYPDDDP